MAALRRRIQRHAGAAETGLLPAQPESLLAALYRHRGLSEAAANQPLELAGLLPPTDLKGIDAAVELVIDAITQGRRILVVGDFDADGATSCAVAVTGLRLLGATEVGYLVPNRFEFGYGLTPEIVAIATRSAPHLLITVDNGISSMEGVLQAQAAGIKVLITDHHLPGAELPPAAAIVNPNQPGCRFASKALAGVGVIFYLLLAVRGRLRDEGWFGAGVQPPNLAELLDLVALGTVADLVPLDGNNRILVEQGLRRIRAGRARPGIQALLEVSGRANDSVVSSDLGFAVGPRLNAAGRMDDMSLGIECLLAADPERARQLAQQLDRFNRSRRETESLMHEEALTELEQQGEFAAEALPVGLALYRPGWHQGVIGILASRLKERYHRPVIVFAPGGEGELKGSARSIPGLHIRDLLDAMATAQPDLIRRFGGHAMAAGLSIADHDYSRFATLFDQMARQWIAPEVLEGIVLSDGILPAAALTLEVAQRLRYGGPWGQHFPEPLFEGEFELLERRIVGGHHLKMSLAADEGGEPLDAIAFRFDLEQLEQLPNRLRLAYRLDLNHYRGVTRLQLVVEHWEAVWSGR